MSNEPSSNKRMTNKETPFPTPGKNDVSPGLVLLADLIERMPTRAQEIVTHEIEKRERDLVLTQEIKTTLSWHPWSTVRIFVLSGAAAFALAWTFSLVAEFVRFYNASADALKVNLPFLDANVVDLTKKLPAQAFGLFRQIPDFGAIEAVYFALVIVMLLAVFKVIFIAIHWGKIKMLNRAIEEVEEEMDVLIRWLNQLDGEKELLEEAKK